MEDEKKREQDLEKHAHELEDKEKISKLESELDRLQNSNKEEDIKRVEFLKEEVQNIKDEHELLSARRYFAKRNLESEKPTKFFCSMNKKTKSKPQFKDLHVLEVNARGEEEIRVVMKQGLLEWEVHKFYWSLYKKEETFCSKEEIMEYIGEVKEVSEDDRIQLERQITLEEVSNTLKNTKNNVAPGAGGFTASFYKVFWIYLKKLSLAQYMKFSKIKICLFL